MDRERRYSEEEVARILDDATEAEARGGHSLASGAGLSLDELQGIGREAGISPELIARAARRLDRSGKPAAPGRTFLGAPISVGRTVYLDRSLTDEEWNRLVVDLRETFDARGRLHAEGSFRQWTNGNLQALLEPTESGQRLRLKTLKGDAMPSLGVGAGMVAIAAVMFVLGILGTGLDPDLPVFLGVVGGFLFAVNRVRLPRWATTRRAQMDAIAERLVAAIEPPDAGTGTNRA